MKTFSMIAIIFLFISTAQAEGFEFSATDSARTQNNCGKTGHWAYAHRKGEEVWYDEVVGQGSGRVVLARNVKAGAPMRAADFRSIGIAPKFAPKMWIPDWLQEFSYKPCSPVPPATIGNILQ